MKHLVKYGLIALVIGVVYYNSHSDDSSYAENNIDLNAVLDVTVDTIYTFEETVNAQAEKPSEDDAFVAFSKELEINYNKVKPALHDKPIAVAPNSDASLSAYEDLNNNGNVDENEKLFLIEVDGENSRVIASSGSGAVNDHHFSGTSLLAGYLIGSMLTRQRAAGANPANKKTRTAAQAARSRAGSGSHSRGK